MRIGMIVGAVRARITVADAAHVHPQHREPESGPYAGELDVQPPGAHRVNRASVREDDAGAALLTVRDMLGQHSEQPPLGIEDDGTLAHTVFGRSIDRTSCTE